VADRKEKKEKKQNHLKNRLAQDKGINFESEQIAFDSGHGPLLILFYLLFLKRQRAGM
jgi:hypothetical protein